MRDVRGDDDVSGIVLKRSKKVEVILAQLATGKIHRDPAHITHRVDVECAYWRQICGVA